MKHKKEVDEFYRKLALNEGNKAFWEAIELKTRIIMPGEERGEKAGRPPCDPPATNNYDTLDIEM